MQEKSVSFNNFEQCMKCTICTAYCPVVPVNPLFPGPKQAGPDGERLRLKKGFFFDENLKLCLNCKRCEAACPSGVRIADIIQSARMRYSRHKPSLRDHVLANTDFMGKAARPFAPAVNAVLKVPAAKVVMDKILKVDKHRNFPEYQLHGFESWFRHNAKSFQEKYPRQISFFHSCSTEFQHTDVGRAFVRVMNALGIGVNLIDEECCGVAMMASGLWNQAERHARHNLEEFRKTTLPIVTVSSSCTFTMREEYPNVLGVDNSDVRDRISIVEKYIWSLVESGAVKLVFKKDFKARAAYHVPCHMEKLGWSIYTRKLMESIPGMELIPLESNCCGIAGTYGFKKENYKYSQEIGAHLFKNIESVNPDYVVCECETCKWQIEMSTRYKVRNPILILEEALDLEDTSKANS